MFQGSSTGERTEKRIIVWVGAFLKRGDGRFLLVRRSQGSSWGAAQWQLVGGKVEWGESVDQALGREIREETGGTIGARRFVDTYAVQLEAKGVLFHAVQIVYTGAYYGATVSLDDEHDGYRWVAPDEVAGMDLITGLGEFISANRGSI